MSSSDERTVLNDRYEIQQRIGRGGMADVFLARDLLLDRPVAIKVLFPEFATDPNFVERFRREAQAAANLNHPNIVGVYDWGKYTNTYFMAMEYVQGRTLADVLRTNGSLNSVQACEIAGEVSAALGFAHRNGVVHRDIKPANILIGSGGQVKVADFGIARALNSPTESNLTQVGAVMGTATYFSPEQAQGAQPDPRSDLYSLGIVLYEMVAGRPPFSGDNPVSIAYKQVHDAPQPLNQLVADVPRPFEAIVAKLLAKSADMRYPNAEALRDDLRRFRNGEPVQALAAAAGAAAAARPAPPVATSSLPRTTAMPSATASAPRTTAMPRTTAQPAQPQQYQPAAGRALGWYWVAGFLALVALIAGGVVLFNGLAKDDKPTSFALPDVTNMLLEDATRILSDANLAFNPLDVENPDVAEGFVYLTDPVAGTIVSNGQTIDVTYNPAKAPITVIDVAGKPLDEALLILQSQGLLIGTTTTETGSTVTPGSVIRTDPAANAQAKQGDTINIVVSGGPDQVNVPATEGLTEADAKATLQADALKLVVTVQPEVNATIAAGRAIRTDPPANTQVTKGSPITLFVSSGQAKVKVPVVEGLLEAQARNQLTAVGLVPNVTFQTVPIGDPNDGRVISQSVPPGTDVDRGTTVKLRIGKSVPLPTTVPTTVPPTTTTTPPTTTTTTTTPPTTTTTTLP